MDNQDKENLFFSGVVGAVCVSAVLIFALMARCAERQSFYYNQCLTRAVEQGDTVAASRCEKSGL